ncbi:proline utilization trans-activator [Microdochium nivale]|nr:proline utilization trans-activator [Microdochium nivale]
MQTRTGTSPSPPPETDSARPYQKRIRLSLACNQCRKRKVRCDTSLPKCRNCVQRNEHCETSDLRRPDHGPGVRALAVKPAPAPAPAPAHHDMSPGSDQPVRDDGSQQQEQSRPAGPPRSLSHSSTRSLSKPQQAPAPGLIPASSPRSQREQSHATVSTPDSHAGRHGSEPAGPDSGSASSRPDLTWVQRAYHISTSGGHHNDDKSMTPTTPDVVVNTDDTAYRVKFAGGSSLQCLCTFVDLHLCSRGLRPVSPGFKQGMMYSEEFELPLMPHLPALPVRPETDGYVAAFMRRVWPLYPVVDEVTLSADVDYIMQVQAMHGDAFARHLPQLTLPTLAVTYAILALGSAELAGQATPLSTSYLTAAYSLYGHLIALPYTVSVQALFLITLALRAQMRDGQAWQVLGQALRIAYSIGLHRTSPHRDAASKATPAPRRPPPACSPGYQSDAGLHSRLWWSCYALERLVQLESGRPSVVHDRVGDGVSNIDSDQGDGRQTPTLPPLLDAATHASEYFVAWVSLAHIMGKISDQFYGQKPRNSAELFTRVYRLDQMLNKWKETLPDSARLRKDAASRASRHAVASNGSASFKFANSSHANGNDSGDDYDDENDDADQHNGRNAATGEKSERFEYQHHLASFLSLQQYMAHITLLRIALIFPHGDFLAEVQRQRDNLPGGGLAQARLINGSDVCLGAARSIITEATTLADEGERSVLLGANPMLVSAMVLALGILRQPTRRLARADLQLFHLGLELVEEYLSRWVVTASGTGFGAGTPGAAAVVTSGGGGSGVDMTGLVCLLRDQVDAYHAQFRRRGAAPASTIASMSTSSGGGQRESTHPHNDNGHARPQQRDGPVSQNRQHEHSVGPQGVFSVSELVATESGPRAASRTSGTSSSDMPPPPPPPQQPGSFGAGGHYTDGNSSIYTSAVGNHGVASSGSLSAMLMDSSGTYDLTPFLDSSLISHGGGDGTAGSHGGSGGGEGDGDYSGGSGGMDTFEGLAFDELWNMIGTDVRADYSY